MFKTIWMFFKGLLSLKWVKWAILGVVAAIIIALSIGAGISQHNCNKLQARIEQRDSVITSLRDSLESMSQPIFNYEVHLAVEDRSVIQCKNTGKGTLNTPSTKMYILRVDSASVAVKAVDPYKD